MLYMSYDLWVDRCQTSEIAKVRQYETCRVVNISHVPGQYKHSIKYIAGYLGKLFYEVN